MEGSSLVRDVEGERVAGQVLDIALERIRPYTGQPRIQFNEEALRELAQSMAAAGQQMPALVRLLDAEQGEYELVEGERRWRAARLAGLTTLRCVVVEVADEDAQFRMSFVANFHRENHTPLEIALALKKLLKQGMTQSGIAEMLGKTQTWVSMYQRILNLEKRLLKLLGPTVSREERLNFMVAQALSRLAANRQWAAYEAIGGPAGTPRQAEALVRRLLNEDAGAKHPNARLRRRSPKDDYKVFITGVTNALEWTRIWGEADVQRLFQSRSVEATEQVGRWLAEIENGMKLIRGQVRCRTTVER